MSIRADSLAMHGAEGRNGGERNFGELHKDAADIIRRYLQHQPIKAAGK